MSSHLEAKSSNEGVDFRLASIKPKIDDLSTLKKMYPDALDECILCLRAEDYKHLFFKCPFARTLWATQGITYVDAIYEINFWVSLH